MARPTGYAGGPVARYLLLGATVFLMLAGLVMIFSAASVSDFVHFGDSYHHLLRQAAWIVFGSIIMVVLSQFDYRRLKTLAMPAWWLAFALLAVVNLLGVVRGGARRWIPLGPLGTLQPSEYARVACVLLAAALVTEWWHGRIAEKQLLWRTTVCVGSIAALVILQPDLGTTLAIVLSVVIVLFLGGIRLRWMGMAGLLLAAVAGLAIVAEPFRVHRLMAFLDPFKYAQDKGYQSVQALLAFGTGGVGGVGLGLSRQKFFYLPEAHTDFILAIIGEEIGLLGTLAIVCAFVAFAYAGFRIALGARDTFGRLLAAGLTASIGAQAVMNMAAVTGLLPVTGKPLPFVSFGGSSMLFTMACVGIVLSVSRFGAAAPRAVRTQPQDKESSGAFLDERRRDSRARISRAGSSRGAARKRA
jgi:cell division protein FtsW